jgi:hypothetical protein
MAKNQTGTLGGVTKPTTQADIARATSEKIAKAKPRKVAVMVIALGYDNIKLHRPLTKITLNLGEKDDVPMWAVALEDWAKRRQEAADADPDYDAQNEGDVALLDEELAATIFREREEAAVAAAQEEIIRKRTDRERSLVGAR